MSFNFASKILVNEEFRKSKREKFSHFNRSLQDFIAMFFPDMIVSIETRRNEDFHDFKVYMEAMMEEVTDRYVN